jgi:hypothetical protein
VPKVRSPAAVLFALLTCLPATAAEVGWSYQVNVNPHVLPSARWQTVEGPDGPQQTTVPNVEYSVALEGLSGGTSPEPVRAFQVQTFGVGFDSGDGTFDPTIHQFDVNFNLKDLASGQSEDLVFKGNVAGAIDQAGANLQFGFDGAQTLTLGGNAYDVELLPYTLTQSAADGAVQAADLPTVTARVSLRGDPGPPADPADPGAPPEAPEPGTLALAVGALVVLGVRAAWTWGPARAG